MATTSPHDDQSKLDAIIASYLEALERGEVVDRELFLQQHPDFAEELRAFFVDFDRLQLPRVQPGRDPDVTFVPQNEPKPGSTIGDRYKLRENIGEGGMGSVWVAEQLQPLKRRVAIKLIKAGMDSKQVLARFEAERQALALMDHPNIAKVFDGGMTDQGRPYFVMEYVKGVPFTEYCDKTCLSLRERLNLFIPVCQAVQHAHHKGIVHRDLKPSNILICLYDGQPIPKVIDFGLAKAMHQQLTEQSIYTAHGVMVGTPLYMSPEQAEHNNLDVDTRTDVYSLGVILYELLTGSTPLEREQLRTAAYNEVLRLIKEVEPPRPSTRLSVSSSLPSIAAQRSIDPRHLQKSIAGDLDWIVMRSLEKERTRRYETANGLARDIERFLNDEAVEACPPSMWYRTKKLARKYKYPLIVAGTGFCVLSASVVGTSYGLRKALLAERAGSIERAKAVQARTEAELEAYIANLSLAQNALDNYRFTEAGEFLNRRQPALRGWEWNYLLAASKTLSCDGAFRGSPVISSRDYNVLLRSDSRTLQVFDRNMKAISSALKPASPRDYFSSGDIEVSPDQSRLAAATNQSVIVWEINGRTLFSVTRTATSNLTFCFLDDNRIIVKEKQTVQIWDAEGRRLGTAFQHQEDDNTCPPLSPDGRLLLAFNGTTGELRETASAAILRKFECGGVVSGASFSADSRRVLINYVRADDASKMGQVWSIDGGPSGAAFSCEPSSSGFVENTPYHCSEEQTYFHIDDDATRAVPGYMIAIRSQKPALAVIGNSTQQVLCDAEGTSLREFLPPRINFKPWSTEFTGDEKQVIAHEGAIPAFYWQNLNDQSGPQVSSVTLSTLCNSESYYRDFDVKVLEGSNNFCVGNSETTSLWDQSGKLLGQVQMRVLDDGYYGNFRKEAFTSSQIFFQATDPNLVVSHKAQLVFDSPSRYVENAEEYCPPEMRFHVSRNFSHPAAITLADLTDSSPTGDAEVHRSETNGQRNDSLAFTRENPAGSAESPSAAHLTTLKAISPGGTRFVTVGDDRVMRLWDATNDRELIRIATLSFMPTRVAFSGGGLQLFAFGADGEIQLWDSRPYSERQKDRDLVYSELPRAREYITTMMPSDLAEDRLERQVNNDASLNPAMRAMALEVLYSERQVLNKFAMSRVDDICNESPLHHIREALIKSEANAKLQRKMLEHFREKAGASAQDFNKYAWAIVKNRNESPENYALALEAAVNAARLRPQDKNVLDTLGVAQYRCGDYSAAIQTLKPLVERSNQPPLSSIGFLAMAHFKSGQLAEAEAAFERLKSVSPKSGDQWVREEAIQLMMPEVAP